LIVERRGEEIEDLGFVCPNHGDRTQDLFGSGVARTSEHQQTPDDLGVVVVGDPCLGEDPLAFGIQTVQGQRQSKRALHVIGVESTRDGGPEVIQGFFVSADGEQCLAQPSFELRVIMEQVCGRIESLVSGFGYPAGEEQLTPGKLDLGQERILFDCAVEIGQGALVVPEAGLEKTERGPAAIGMGRPLSDITENVASCGKLLFGDKDLTESKLETDVVTRPPPSDRLSELLRP